MKFQPSFPNSDLHLTIDSAARETLLFAAPVLGGLHLFFAGWLAAAGAASLWQLAIATASAALFFGLFAWLRTRPLPTGWSHPLSAAAAGLAALNGLLHLYQAQEPQQSTGLLMVVIGMGALILSTRWLALTLVLSLAGWGAVALLSFPSRLWWHFGLALLGAAGLAAVIHLLRLRAVMQIEVLQRQDASRKAELEAVLKTTEEAQRSLATSMAVGQRVTSILDLDVLLDQVARLIQERFRCYFVGIFLLDAGGEYTAGGEYVQLRAAAGKAGGKLAQTGLRLRVGEEGIIGWVAAHRRPACVANVLADRRYTAHELLPAARAELALPLEMGATLLGVLDMESEQEGAFRDDDVPFMQLLADQVAIAINNASLYAGEKSRRRLAENLYEVSRALSGTLNLAEEFDLILAHLAAIVPYDRASVLLRRGDELDITASQGFPQGSGRISVPIKPGDVFDEICRTQKPLSIPDVFQRPDWQQVAGLPQARSWLGIPLIHSDEVTGMLSLTRETPHAYADDDIALAATFASQAAIAIENARLYEQITRFNQDLENQVQQRTEALQNAFHQLERLDRAKSDFIGIASHELRTPLTLLSGYSQMMADIPAVKADEHTLAMLGGIQNGARRLYEIIDSMLDVAKIDSRELELHPTPVLIPSLVRFVFETLRQPAEDRNLTLSSELSNLPPIEADLEALKKVFYNLVVNAIKYTPDGGRVHISGRALSPGEFNLAEGGLEIVISDTGIGIDTDLHELIFTKFFRTGELSLHSTGKTKFKGGGPGLGLAIVKGVISAHNGLIWVVSPGCDEQTCPGSQFHVVLPLRQNSN